MTESGATVRQGPSGVTQLHGFARNFGLGLFTPVNDA